nr:hypothetical protein [uncultured Blautia sp.]
MYIPDESGINSLGGFAYQIKVFVSYMLSMEEGMQAEFETADDIAISKMTPDIIDDNEDKFRNLIVSPNGIKAIQVKRTSITEKVAKQVLFNWMLLEKSGKTITNYILFTDKSYKNSDIVFDVSAETRKIQEIEETTYENFEDAKYKLQISGMDTPMNRLEETKQRSNSYAESEQIRYGAGIYLTREDEIERQISWEGYTD